MRNNAEKCEYLAENYLLEFQKAWNVFLKGAGALWKQKSTEKIETCKKDWQLEDAELRDLLVASQALDISNPV